MNTGYSYNNNVKFDAIKLLYRAFELGADGSHLLRWYPLIFHALIVLFDLQIKGYTIISAVVW
jgi:hypothetical protein